jgi:uncharacterized Zn-finger protein
LKTAIEDKVLMKKAEVESSNDTIITVEDIPFEEIIIEEAGEEGMIENSRVQKSIVCEKCGYLFTTKHHLNRHKARKHSDESKKYECQICENRFFLKYELQRHQVKHYYTYIKKE